MTISTEVRKAGPFIGNGSASVFPFAFKVFKAADLIVVRRQDNIGEETTLVPDSDYHVTLNSNQDTTPGGVVTLVAGALASGFTLVVSSELPYLQPTDLTNQGGFYPKVITNALDRLTIFCQQLAEITGRTLKLPITAPTNISAEIPLPNPSELIAWNETGTGLTTVSPQSLVTSIAYGSATADLFAGDGVTTTFPLTTNPASVNNLDVSIGGHSQRPVQGGVGDYSWNGGASITFVVPPPAPTVPGDKNVLVRYMQAIPVSDSEALHAQTREALRRGYAEAGFNLVDGSFETGGTLTAATDVLWQESTGAAYAWTGALPKVVAPGFDPVGVAGFELRTDVLLRTELMQYGEASLWLRTRIIAAESRFGGMIFGDSSLTAANKNSTAIQAALDYAESIGGAIVEIPCGLGFVYYNAAPVIPKDTTLLSKSLWLVKVGNHVNADYSIDALVHTKKYTGDNCSRFGIKGIIFKGNARSAYGIYGDATDHSFIEDCFFINVDRGHRFADAWLCRWTNVTWSDQGYAEGYLGFEGVAGTSNSFVNCWSKNFARGYDLGQIHYSELSSCGVDSFSVFAYSGGQAVTLNSCGAEDGVIVDGGYVFGSGARSATYNSCECLNIAAAAGVVPGAVSLFDFNGSTAVINSFRLPSFNTAGVFNTVKMQSGAGAFVNGGSLPSNAYCVAKISDSYSRLEVSTSGYHSVYAGIGDKTTPNYNFGTSADYLNGFRKSSEKLAAGKSTLDGSVTFTAEDEAHENSYTAFTGGSPVTINLLSFTHAGSTSRSSVFLEVFLSGPAGLSKYKGSVEIVNGTAGSVTLTNDFGAAYTISGSVVGGVLQFTLGTTYSKALVKVTVSQWSSAGKDTFTWA